MKKIVSLNEVAKKYPDLNLRGLIKPGTLADDLSRLTVGNAIIFEPCPGPHKPSAAYPSEYYCGFQAKVHGAAKRAKVSVYVQHTGDRKGVCDLVVTLKQLYGHSERPDASNDERAAEME